METIEMFYPEINAEIEKYEFSTGIEVEVYSSKKSYFDWARIKFTKEFQEKIEIERKAVAQINLGYDGIFEKVFEGYVSSLYDSGHNEIMMKDKMILLEETFVSNTFLDATPQEIISYCLSKAGVTEFKMPERQYPVKNVVPVNNKNVLAVIHQVHSTWGISRDFYFHDGIFYWGVKPIQEKIYKFEYGVNIISLSKTNERWELETVSAPFIKHSHVIQIEHPEISGEVEVEKVSFKTTGTGFVRTIICF